MTADGSSTDPSQGAPADHRLRVYANVAQLIAGIDNPTPLVRLNRSNPHRDFPIYVKLERYNPFGSVKDRIALSMLSGLQVDGKTIVEPSSGNTGLALVGLANALGIPIEIAVPERIPEEKKLMLRLLGAHLREADDALCPLFPTEGARGLVRALVESPATRDRYVSPNQYENELNVQAHYQGTGPEIWKQTRGQVRFFFAGLGTGGTISGVGRYLKEQDPSVKVIAVEPASPDHRLPGMKRITGLADEFIPKIINRGVIDDTVQVSDADAYGTALALARQDGMMVGPTTGAIVYAALTYGAAHKGLAVAISPDDAFKYASFYKDILDLEAARSNPEQEFDLCDLICPLSKIRAMEVVDDLAEGETARIVLGNRESLKSVMMELKQRGIRPEFQQEGEDKFILTIVR